MKIEFEKCCGTCRNFVARTTDGHGRCSQSPDSPQEWQWHQSQGKWCPCYIAMPDPEERLNEIMNNALFLDALTGG